MPLENEKTKKKHTITHENKRRKKLTFSKESKAPTTSEQKKEKTKEEESNNLPAPHLQQPSALSLSRPRGPLVVALSLLHTSHTKVLSLLHFISFLCVLSFVPFSLSSRLVETCHPDRRREQREENRQKYKTEGENRAQETKKETASRFIASPFLSKN